jgi:hypothetical protein
VVSLPVSLPEASLYWVLVTDPLLARLSALPANHHYRAVQSVRVTPIRLQPTPNTMDFELPDYLFPILESCPRSGQGVHR